MCNPLILSPLINGSRVKRDFVCRLTDFFDSNFESNKLKFRVPQLLIFIDMV